MIHTDVAMQVRTCDTCNRLRDEIADLMTDYASEERTRQRVLGANPLASIHAERRARHAARRLAIARAELFHHQHAHELARVL